MSCQSDRQKSLWNRTRCISSVIVFTSFFTFLSSSGFATWQYIAKFPTTVNCSFFFDEQRGFIGLDENYGIYSTSNGGQTWAACSTPAPSIFGGFISDIFMKDSLNGWASIDVPYSNPIHGLWFTSDGGISWHVQNNVQVEVTSVYETPSAVIYGSRFSSLHSSVNRGASFASSAIDNFNGINFTDNLHGVASEFRTASGNSYPPAYWTSDGGISWNPATVVATEAWGVYAQKGSSNFYIAGEKVQPDPGSTEIVYASSDYGVTWQTAGLLQGRTTGHIAGVSSVIYTQSWTRYQYPNDPSFYGMNRSTDGGKTWKNVGGPENFRDSRFSVTGCLGGVVYAYDINGGVWKTTDGGDGEIHEPPHNPNVVPNHIDLSADLCHTTSANLNYYNLSCDPSLVETISFIDSTDPAVASGALSFSRYPKLPQTLNPTSIDYLTINWQPKKMGIAKPLSTTYIKIHSTMLNGTIVFDTLIAVNSQSFADLPMVSLSATNVAFDSLNICDRYRDTTLSFTNGSCDTLWLDSAVQHGSSDWQVLDPQTQLPFTLPIGLAPNQTTNFLVEFSPSSIGSQLANLKLHFFHQGLTKDTLLSFSGKSYQIMSVDAAASVALAPTSICTTIDTTIAFYNLNCDTLTVDGIVNTNTSAFSDLSGITFPYQLPPNGTLNYHVRYNALKNVTSNATVTFNFHLLQDTGSLIRTISGVGIPGTSLFETAPATAHIIFPDRIACSPQDSIVFTIVNPGCDTLSVLKSALSVAGLPAISYRTEPALPARLSQPGEKVRVCIYLQADTATVNDGALEFLYQTSDGSIHDSLFTIHALVARGERIAMLSENAVDMGVGSLCTERDTSVIVNNPACPKLTISNIVVTGNYYSLKNPRITPFILAEGESDTIWLTFDPTTSGSEGGVVQVYTDADNNPIRSIPITASTKDIDHVTFKLIQTNTNVVHAGDTAIFAFVPNADWSGDPIRKIDFSISTRQDLLTFDQNHIVQSDPSFQTVATPVISGDQIQLNVQLKSATGIILHKDKPLVTFNYLTALTGMTSTPVTLSLLALNDADPHYLNCILSPFSQDSDFVLNLECGAKTLIDFMNGTLPILSEEAHPNPVTAQTYYQAEIPFSTAVAGSLEFICYDVIGKPVTSRMMQIDVPGKYSVHFDGSKIPGGTYEYVLKIGGALTQGRVVVLK